MCGNCVKWKAIKLNPLEFVSKPCQENSCDRRVIPDSNNWAGGEHVQPSFAKTLPFDRLGWGASGARRDERENRGDEACMDGRGRICYSTA